MQRESPVGVVNSVDRQITNASNKKPMTFVGHFVPFEVCAKKRSFGKIVSGLQCTELPSTTHMLNAFDVEKHLNAFKCELPWLVRAKPAFDFETELAIKKSVQDQKPFASLLISVDDKRHVAVDVDGARECMLNILLEDHKRQKQKQKTSLELLAEKCEKDICLLSVEDMDASDVTVSGLMEASKEMENDSVFMANAKHASFLHMQAEHHKEKRVCMSQLEAIAFKLKKKKEDIGFEDIGGQDVPRHLSDKYQQMTHDLHAHFLENKKTNSKVNIALAEENRRN